MFLLRVTLLCVLCLAPCAAEAALVTHYNFNAYDGDATMLAPDSGTGQLTLAGWSTAQLAVSSDGTDQNAVEPPGTTPNNAIRLANVNNSTMTLQTSTIGFQDLVLSFVTKGPNSTYDEMSLAYAINGGMFQNFGTITDPSDPNNYELRSFDLSSVTALNGQADVALRLTFAGANENANTALLLDNLRLDTASVPEADSLAMAGLAGLMFAGMALQRFRRRLATPGDVAPV